MHPELPFDDWCASYSDPRPFTIVEQIAGDPSSIGYTAEKGFGYEELYRRSRGRADPLRQPDGWRSTAPSMIRRTIAPSRSARVREALYDSFIAEGFLEPPL